MSAVKKTVTTTVEAEWHLKGADPTIAEWILIAEEVKRLDVPRNLTLKLERSMEQREPHKIVMEKYVKDDSDKPLPVYRGESK